MQITGIGIGAVAKLLKVSRSRADQLSRQAGFPAPKKTVLGRLWNPRDIEKWMQKRDGGQLTAVNASGVARLLGISRQRADELSRRSDFPEPIKVFGGRVRMWNLKDIERYHHERQREETNA